MQFSGVPFAASVLYSARSWLRFISDQGVHRPHDRFGRRKIASDEGGGRFGTTNLIPLPMLFQFCSVFRRSEQ